MSRHRYSGQSAGKGDERLAQWARWPNLAQRLTCDERGIERRLVARQQCCRRAPGEPVQRSDELRRRITGYD